MMSEEDSKKEIYTYRGKWMIYAMNWSVRPDKPYRLAVGSFIEDYSNKVQIIELNEETGNFETRGGAFKHPYPATKLMWIPDKDGTKPDLLATTGDYLRLWNVGDDDSVSLHTLLNNNKSSEFCAPLTSFDWNETDPNIIGTSSIDTTCTIWDIEKETAVQLIAHDKEVYDIAFARGNQTQSKNIFASVSADGSVRMFDLRNLEHSTILYESSESTSLLRLGWNRQDDWYLATFGMDSQTAIVLDIRIPSRPAAELSAHTACINALQWAPHSSCHIATAGDDAQTLIWDLSSMPEPVTTPILAYEAGAEINQMQWSMSQPDWIAITYDHDLQILRV